MEMSQMTSNDVQSQLDIYLDEGSYVGNDLDVLEYWKLNKHRFPELAIMACDILSIPITTVASESLVLVVVYCRSIEIVCSQKLCKPLFVLVIGCMILKKLDLLVKNVYSLNFFLFCFFLFLTYNLQNKHFYFINCRCAGSRGYSII